MRATRVMALALAAGVALTVSACGSSGDSGDSGGTDGTITLSMGTDPAHTITTDATESVSATVLNMLYDGLYMYDVQGKTVPVVAEAVPTSTDNVHWSIKLKTGLKFQNGEDVNAESFVRAWNYGAYAPNAQGGAEFFSRVKGYDDMQPSGPDPDGKDGPLKAPDPKAKELTGLKATDASTLDIELSKPFSGFGSMLGYRVFSPMAKACLEAIEACKEKPIGNGPFQMKSWNHGVDLTVERWDAYAGTKPAYKTLTWRMFLDGAADFPDFKADKLDIGVTPEAEYADAKATYAERMLEVPSTSLSYIGYPMYDPVFQKKELRQALSLAVNRDLLNQALYQGRYKTATSFSSPAFPGGAEGTCAYCTFDLAKAKSLLAAAGGWPEGKKLNLWINTAASGANENWVKAFGDQIKQNLGIDYTYQTLEWAAYLKKTGEHGIDGPYRMGWTPDYVNVENYLTPVWGGSKDINRAGYENPAFTAALAAADAAPADTAAAKYIEAEKILGEDMPGIPMFWSKSATVIGSRIELSSAVINPVLNGVILRDLKLASS